MAKRSEHNKEMVIMEVDMQSERDSSGSINQYQYGSSRLSQNLQSSGKQS